MPAEIRLRQDEAAEVRMVHEQVILACGVRMDSAIAQCGHQRFTQLVSTEIGSGEVALCQALGDGAGVQLVQIAQFGAHELFHAAVRHVGCETMLVVVVGEQLAHVGLHLLVRDLERVADVVEQGREPPEPEEVARGLRTFRQAVLFVVRCANAGVVAVHGQTDEEHVDAVRVVVAMLHEQRARVRLVLGEHLEQQASRVVTRAERLEDLAVAVVDVERVLARAAFEEPPDGRLEAQPVEVAFHVVGDGAWAGAATVRVLERDAARVGRVEVQVDAIVAHERERFAAEVACGLRKLGNVRGVLDAVVGAVLVLHLG